MLYNRIFLKVMKKWKPAYKKSLVTMQARVADPVKRKKLNDWFLKMTQYEKTRFHRLYGRLFQNSSIKIEEGAWQVEFAGKYLKFPLRNKSLLLDWDLALAVSALDGELKTTYKNFLQTGKVKVFFDIGANYGTHSVLFLSHGVHTVSFEPIPFLKKEIEELCRFNGYEPNVVDAAVGNKKGEAVLWIPPGETWEATIVETEAAALGEKHKLEKVTVAVTTVDDYVSESGLDPQLLKIDTEGNELNVLEGSVKTIHRLQPAILFETNRKEQRKPLWDFFAAQNYTIFPLPYKPGEKNKRFTAEMFFESGAINYIAVPSAN